MVSRNLLVRSMLIATTALVLSTSTPLSINTCNIVATAEAAESDYTDVYKTCCTVGNNCWYKVLDDNVTLVIYGTGDVDKSVNVAGGVSEEDIQHIIIEDGITSISDRAFEDYPNIKSISIPDTVTNIGYRAFALDSENFRNQGDGIIEKVVIPSSVKIIGDEAFMNHKLNGGILFGKGLIKIGESAFEDCSINQKKVVLPEGLKTIGREAFKDAFIPEKASQLVVPSTVTFIGNGALDCTYDAVVTIKTKDTKCEGALGVSSGLYIVKSGSKVC